MAVTPAWVTWDFFYNVIAPYITSYITSPFNNVIITSFHGFEVSPEVTSMPPTQGSIQGNNRSTRRDDWPSTHLLTISKNCMRTRSAHNNEHLRKELAIPWLVLLVPRTLSYTFTNADACLHICEEGNSRQILNNKSVKLGVDNASTVADCFSGLENSDLPEELPVAP